MKLLISTEEKVFVDLRNPLAIPILFNNASLLIKYDDNVTNGFSNGH